ncbi:hypothetical protein [Actinoplanes sp. NPDC020271]|uniref:golvesin C-terminal-like domain-containing protein n=1 Tax=Actinoplanes sp. NPDC020271 TaxID=3363896 RepID=UPI0037AA9819
MRRGQRLRAGVAFMAAAALATVVGSAGPAQAAPKDDGHVHLTGSRGKLPDPASALGSGYRESGDVIAKGVGDAGGFHVMIAREKDAYEWKTLASLGTNLTGLGSFTGYTCVTGSGKYVVAVYAPAVALNKPALVRSGGFAAVVDMATGQVHEITGGVEIAYFNPACGPTDRVLLTRSVGDNDEQTDLLAVDAASGRVLSTRRVDAQLTSPTASATTDYGIVRGRLVRVDDAGVARSVATVTGRPFAVRATAQGSVDVLTVVDEKALAWRYDKTKVTELGSAPRTRLQLEGLAGGRNALIGDVSGLHASGKADLVTVASDTGVEAVSTKGHLLLQRAASRQVTQGSASVEADDHVDIAVRALHSGRVATGTITPVTVPSETPSAAAVSRAAAPAVTTLGVGPVGAVAKPSCAVERNQLNRQVPQPDVRQVEWAVDLAVHNRLDVLRPDTYLNTRLPGYRPQDLFPYPDTSVAVPAQLMLAILAQETNEAQASWHAVPGDAGNPLVSDYYGNRNTDIDSINYDNTDCGYGIGQVTTGMRAEDTEVVLSKAQQVAAATDYAANIAASLYVLVDKWKQLNALGMTVNGGDPHYIENWYLAAWGYNTGIYMPGQQGTNWGLGWLNNPANPRYPYNRDPFLRGSLDDASHPGDWPYQERIMGWAERPQWQWIDGLPAPKYLTPTFGTAPVVPSHLDLPADHPSVRYSLFCNAVGQACDYANQSNPCPANSDACWWHGSRNWTDCPSACATERLLFTHSDPEPATERTYPKDCGKLKVPSGVTATVVDDLPDSAAVPGAINGPPETANGSYNVLGCPGEATGGKFALRVGSPAGDVPHVNADGSVQTYENSLALTAQIDLHQLGAGYQGHMWFTHTYPASRKAYHRVVGAWTPNLKAGAAKYDVIVHLPSHGGQVTNAQYYYYNSATAASVGSATCKINQDTNGVDKWVNLGTYTLSPGARFQLTNDDDSANGTIDVAFDAMAFLSPGTTAKTCGTDYTG